MSDLTHYTESFSEFVDAKTELKEQKKQAQAEWLSEFSYWFWYIIGGIFFGMMMMASKGLMMWN